MFADGRYSEVVVNSSLTVHLKSKPYFQGFSQLIQMCSLVLRIIDNKRPSLGADDAREEKISKKMKNDFKAKTSNFSVAGIPPFSHNSSQSFFPSSDIFASEEATYYSRL